MKKAIIFVTTALATLALTAEAFAGSGFVFYKKMIEREKIGRIREYYSEDLTADILVNRGDDIIVEKVIGRVKNNRRDGYVLDTDPNYNYISYKNVKGARKGDVILTVCIYTPGSDAEDDICGRFDYIIDRAGK